MSVNALEAHCNHGDHSPQGVIGDAKEFCGDLGLVDDAFDKCVRKFAIGADCSRGVDNMNAVANLCGADFVPLDLCP